jgi:hypothetical protein
MGYISSSTFFKTGSGGPLRDYLRNKATLETVVDFGDHQIFEGVTTYPAILTMRNDPPSNAHEIVFWKIKDLPKDNFDTAYRDHAEPYPQSALASGSWELENPALRNLRNKIVAGKPTLKVVYGSPLYGIKTGRNEAFVIDRKTRDALIAKDPKSVEILKPFLVGKDLKRWRIESSDQWLIFTRRGVKIEDYQAIESYLEERRALIEPKPDGWKPSAQSQKWEGRKSGAYEWFEIQDTVDYWREFAKPKVIYNRFVDMPQFLYDDTGSLINDAPYFIPSADRFLSALLNSKLSWYMITSYVPNLRGGFVQINAAYINPLPIPPATDAQKAELATLAESAQTAAEERYRLQQEITRRIPDLARSARGPDLAPSGQLTKLTERLKSWWDLPDFAAFQAEVKKAFKADIPLKERNDWENWISETRQKIHALTAEITAIEAAINTRVYALFGLTPDEITLLESSL